MTTLSSVAPGSTKRVTITINPDRTKVDLDVTGNDQRPVLIRVDPIEFARAAASLGIEGLTYVEPIKVPTGIGAVIESKLGTKYVKVGLNAWLEANGGRTPVPYSDNEILHSLRNGATVLSEGYKGE